MSSGQVKTQRELETPDPLSYALPFIVGSTQQEIVPITGVGAASSSIGGSIRLGRLANQHQRIQNESSKVARRSKKNVDADRVLEGC